MKVLLINCPIALADSKTDYPLPPMGLLYIKEYVQRYISIISIELIDPVLKGIGVSKTCALVKEIKPDIIGINVFSPFFSIAKTIINEIKEKDNLIVIGGPHPTLKPEESIMLTQADVVVIGDGEISFYEILQSRLTGKEMSKIKGICIHNNGSVIKTEPRLPLDDLDSFPFPFSDKSTFISYNECINGGITGFIVSSRGCPFNCIYCISPVICKRHWRSRSVENIMQEIKIYKDKFEMSEIHFLDDNFTFNIDRLKKFCEIIEPYKLKWRALSRVGLDYKVLLMMKSSGCFRLSFGIESGSEEILKKIKKNISLKEANETLGFCHDLGISCKVFFIIGFPFERIEHITMTINTAVEWKNKYNDLDIAFNIAKPYAGSELYKYTESIVNFMMIQADASLSDKDKNLIEKYGTLPSVSINPYFSVRDLICIIEAAYKATTTKEKVTPEYLISLRGTL